MPDATLRPHDSVVFQVEGLEPGAQQTGQFLANTDSAILGVRFLKPGQQYGPTMQEQMNGIWFVKSGNVQLTTEGGELIGELGAGDGVTIPRGTVYTFEAIQSADGSVAQLLQFQTTVAPLPAQLTRVKRELGLL